MLRKLLTLLLLVLALPSLGQTIHLADSLANEAQNLSPAPLIQIYQKYRAAKKYQLLQFDQWVENIDSPKPSPTDTLHGDKAAIASVKNALEHYNRSIEAYAQIPQSQSNANRFKKWGDALAQMAYIENSDSLYRESIGIYGFALGEIPRHISLLKGLCHAATNLAEITNKPLDYDQCNEICKYASLSLPNDAQLYCMWGQSLATYAKITKNEYQYSQSYTKFEKAIELSPSYNEAYIGWANALISESELTSDEALLHLAIGKTQKAIALNPSAKANLSLAHAYLALGKTTNDDKLLTQSIECGNNAIARNKQMPVAYRILGDALTATKEYKAATQSYEAAIDIKPDYVDAYIGLGDALTQQGKAKNENGLLDFACATYADAAKIAPTNAHVYSKWGEALFAQAKIKNNTDLLRTSGDKYSKAAELDSTNASTYYHWAQALSDYAFQKRDSLVFEEAYSKYIRAVQLAPSEGKYYLEWAKSLSVNGIFIAKDSVLLKNSLPIYNFALRFMPNHSEVLTNWGITLVKLGDMTTNADTFAQAIPILQKTVQVRNYNRICFNYYLSAFVAIARIEKEKTETKWIELFESEYSRDEYNDYYEHASAFYALIGNTNKALHYLDLNMKETHDSRFGCKAIEAIENNTDYDSVRQEPRYMEIIKKYCDKKDK